MTNAVGVKLDRLTKVFPVYGKNEEFKAVNDVTIHIRPGEMVTLLGPSGCGKTTILRMLAGFEIPTRGTITVGDTDVTGMPPNLRNIGMMFQSYALFPHMSVFENVAYGLRLKKIPEKEIRERVDSVLDLMQILPLAQRMPNQISGGQQQRVALSRAVVTEPSVLLFDEPLSNLDAKLREYMRDELRKIQQRVGITSLYVTHDQTEAMAISDQVIIMRGGIVEQQGTAMDIYVRPDNQFVAGFMGAVNFVKASVRDGGGDRMHVAMLGTELSLPASCAASRAENMVCMIRPESLLIEKNGAIPAKVLRWVYLGQVIQYVLDIFGESVTVVDYRHHIHGIFGEGEELRLNLMENALRLLPA